MKRAFAMEKVKYIKIPIILAMILALFRNQIVVGTIIYILGWVLIGAVTLLIGIRKKNKSIMLISIGYFVVAGAIIFFRYRSF